MKSLNKRFIKIRQLTLLILIVLNITFPLKAQEQADAESSLLNIERGSVLTGFSAGWASSSRDSYNHEFERGIKEFSVTIDALYFLSNHFSVGPVLSYNYLYRDFEDFTFSGESFSDDRWNWNIVYGGQLGWFTPVENLFGTSLLGKSSFFTKAGMNWQRSRQKRENRYKTEPNIQIGYAISTGLLFPLGKRIGLETSLNYQVRRTRYRHFAYQGSIENRELVSEDIKWPSTISLGVGLKISL